MNPATCGSCLHYYQKGQGTGLCMAGGKPYGAWVAPGKATCGEYTADSPEVGKIKVVIPDLGGATLVVTDTVKSAELLGMVRPKGTKGYVVARCEEKGAGPAHSQAPPPLPITKKQYGAWVGNPTGTPEDPEHCIKEVWPHSRGGGWIPYQCRRKRGWGPDGLCCLQHARGATHEI